MTSLRVNNASPAVQSHHYFAQCSSHLFALWWLEVDLLSCYGSRVSADTFRLHWSSAVTESDSDWWVDQKATDVHATILHDIVCSIAFYFIVYCRNEMKNYRLIQWFCNSDLRQLWSRQGKICALTFIRIFKLCIRANLSENLQILCHFCELNWVVLQSYCVKTDMLCWYSWAMDEMSHPVCNLKTSIIIIKLVRVRHEPKELISKKTCTQRVFWLWQLWLKHIFEMTLVI